MNRHQRLQEIYEATLLHKIAQASPSSLLKEAGLFQELGLEQIGESVKNSAKNAVINEDSPSGYLDALGKVLLSGTLFKIHPVLGVAYAAAQALGIDVGGIISDVLARTKEALEEGRTLSESEFDSIAKQAVIQYPLTKTAQTPKVPFLPAKGGSLMERVFGNLFQKGKLTKASWLAKGLIIWTLKTALLGAGILTATGAATGLIKGLMGSGQKEKTKDHQAPPAEESGAGSAMVAPSVRSEKPSQPKTRLRPSGAGEKEFKNDENNMWVVPLVAGDIEETLLTWVEDIYPQLSGYDHIIERHPAFKRTGDLLRINKSSRHPDSLLVPIGLTSRKQIVDLFAPQVASKIGL